MVPNINFPINDPKLYVSSSLYQLHTIKNHQNLFENERKSQFITINSKQKVRIKTQQMNIDIFSNQILLKLIDYLF